MIHRHAIWIVLAIIVCGAQSSHGALIDKALGALADGRPQEARRYAGEVLEDDRTNNVAMLILARTEPDGHTARSWARQIIDLGRGGPAMAEAFLILVRSYAAEEQWHKIITATDEYFRIFGDSGPEAEVIYWWTGLALVQEGYPEAAEERFHTLATEDRNSETCERFRLLLCDARRDPANAVGGYRKLLDTNDPFVESQCLLGLVNGYQALEEADRALLYHGMLAERYPFLAHFADLTEEETTQSVDAPISREAETLAGVIYTVQLGAFADKHNAIKLRNRYRDEDYPVYMFSRRVAKKTYWVVQVGAYRSLELARKLQEKLEHGDNATYRVVIR